MKKFDFLSTLEANLDEYPQPWVASIIEYYDSLILSEEKKGLDEATILKNLGDPYTLALSCRKNGFKDSLFDKKDDDTSRSVSEEGVSSNNKVEKPIAYPGEIALPTIPANTFFRTTSRKFFRIMTFLVFLLISLPFLLILVLLFLLNLLVVALGIGGIAAVIIVPEFINFTGSLSKLALIFGTLGSISLGIVVILAGILLSKTTIRLMKNILGKLTSYLRNRGEERMEQNEN